MEIHLDEPPEVVNLGIGVHGLRRDRDVFQLPDLWQLHVYSYDAELVIDGVRHELRPGVVSLIPAGAQVEYRYRGRSQHLYAHVRPSESGVPQRIPVVQDAGAELPMLSGLLERAVVAWPQHPSRAVAEVWTALWRVAGLGAQANQQHPAMGAAIAYIEANLASPITVPAVARAADVSHNHLIRLFRAELGCTVVSYIRRRRLDRARHLLRESTLSIPAIAATVGMAELQTFNKACRRELGASPRAIRAS